MVGSAPNDRLCSSVYTSQGELSFKISGLAENMQAKNSSILHTPAKPTAGRRGFCARNGQYGDSNIDVYRVGTLIVTTPNDGSYIDSTGDTAELATSIKSVKLAPRLAPMRRQ